MNKQGKKLIALASALLITTVLFLAGYEMENVNYCVKTDKFSTRVRIVFVSDLHNCFFGGTDQAKLMYEIDKAQPDAVIFGGDVLDAWGGTSFSLKIMKMTSEKYPCFYTPGNHELMRDDMDEFCDEVSALGIKIPLGGYYPLEIGGNEIRIYGAIDKMHKNELEKCFDSLDDRYYNILLAHQPEQIDAYLDSGDVKFDLILSGHAHGGQWRLPGILEQGLYAPDQGVFPDITTGMYEYGDSVHIISRGLAKPARMIFIPRIFNRPELSVIDING